MVIELFNFWYFLYIFLGFGLFFGLYFLLRKKSYKVKYWTIAGLLIFNLALHFIKLLFEPYTTYPEIAASQIWFVNICAVSILLFPFIFFSKNKSLKDFMFYLGVLSGFLAIIMPIDNLGREVFSLESNRFYLAHMIIIIAPLLMITLNLHKISYKRIWAMPLWISIYLLIILAQNVLQSEMGIIEPRGDDFLNITFHNPTFVWGPGDDPLAKLFSVFTPGFMTRVPYGPYKGQPKYWPFFWMLPAAFIYFLTIPFIFNLIIGYSRREIIGDVKMLISKVKPLFNKNAKNEDSEEGLEIDNDTPPQETEDLT